MAAVSNNGRTTRVRVTRRLPEAVETRLMELFSTTLNGDDTPLDAEGLKAAVADCDVLVPTVTDRIDAEVIEAAGPDLKLIASFGTGVDHIDLKAAQAKGITVTNTPGVLTEDTADVAMALMLAVARRMGEGERLVRSGQWTGWAPTQMLGLKLAGKRLGIIGMGRIGEAIATRARAFGLSIHYHNRRRAPADVEQRLEATFWQDLDQMLARMDIISVNCPHTPATHHLLSDKRLSLLPSHAVLVNTARGPVVDEEALIRALQTGEIAGAGLDVYENEPEVPQALRELENAVVLPHLGSATREGRQAMGDKVIINIKTFTDSHRPPDRVLPGIDD
ncbi:MAG: D-glycerate dehydrogenase [Alphaproteobacteria bacterium]|nr:D-glycerate dehydrogenase [Alphaproteobacteria bacterium SS10]